MVGGRSHAGTCPLVWVARNQRMLGPTMVRELDFDDDRAPELRCPYCGEPADVDVDPGGAAEQTFEQDCTVCCRPWRVHVARHRDGEETVTLEREDD